MSGPRTVVRIAGRLAGPIYLLTVVGSIGLVLIAACHMEPSP